MHTISLYQGGVTTSLILSGSAAAIGKSFLFAIKVGEGDRIR